MFYKAIQKIKVAWFFRHNAYVYVNFSAELIVDRTTSGLALLHKLTDCWCRWRRRWPRGPRRRRRRKLLGVPPPAAVVRRPNAAADPQVIGAQL